MTKEAIALQRNVAFLHNLELFGYLLSADIRRNINFYQIEKECISGVVNKNDFMLLEKDLKDSTLGKNNKKIIKLS